MAKYRRDKRYISWPSADLAGTRAFCTEVMGCRVGREDTNWIDLDLFGHQRVLHDCGGAILGQYFNPVDAHQVPPPHFGVILQPRDCASTKSHILADRLRLNRHLLHRSKTGVGSQRTLSGDARLDYEQNVYRL